MRSLPSPRYSIYRTFKRIFRSFFQLLSVGHISNSHNKQLVKINQNKKFINGEISGIDTQKSSDDKKIIKNTRHSYFINNNNLQFIKSKKTGHDGGSDSSIIFNGAPLKFGETGEINSDFKFNFINSKELSMKKTKIRRTKFLKRITTRSKIHIKLSNKLVSSFIEIVNQDPVQNISRNSNVKKNKNKINFKKFKSKRKLFSTAFRLIRVYI